MSLAKFCLFSGSVLASCAKPGVPVNTVGALGSFEVVKLFTADGCTVHRFTDDHRYIYFTNCSGSAHWSQHCGKGCVSPESVSGGANEKRN